MKWFASKKIDLDHVKSWIKVGVSQIKDYVDSLDPVTKVFRLIVILTCLYSVFLLNRIKDAQSILIRNSQMVQEWKATGTPTVAGEATPSAKLSTTPTAMPTPTYTATPILTSTLDTTPPSFTEITGPPDGGTINFANVCFPIRLYDDTSSYPNLYVQYQFDSVWSGWSNNLAPCFQNLSNGTHTFSVQAKDQTGNISSLVTRTFTVQVN